MGLLLREKASKRTVGKGSEYVRELIISKKITEKRREEKRREEKRREEKRREEKRREEKRREEERRGEKRREKERKGEKRREKERKGDRRWKLYCVTVCHTAYSFVHTSFLANVLCNESLVCFKASGFCYTISTGPSLGLLLDMLLFPCVMEILKLWICRTGSFMNSGSS
jgi:hypothetical protein